MSVLRKYKISKIINKPLICDEGKAIAFIENWLFNLTLYKPQNYESIFYMSCDGNFVLQINDKTKFLIFNSNVTDVERLYGFHYTNIIDIVKYKLGKKYKDYNVYFDIDNMIEKKYKNEIGK